MSSGPAGEVRVPGARTALALLVLINLFNYIDRQILAAVEPEISGELGHLLQANHLGLDNLREQHAWQAATAVGIHAAPNLGGGAVALQALAVPKFDPTLIGLLPLAFLLSYMAFAPAFGLLADRVSRWWVIGFGVILWSLASGASGWEWGLGAMASYWALFATRCLVGVGEAAYGPVAPAIIADLFPASRRGQVMSFFYLAIPIGGAMGYAVGELISTQAHGWHGYSGWRWAFFSVVLPGLVLGLCCWLVPDPPRGVHEPAARAPVKPSLAQWWHILAIPSYFYNTLGMTMMCFAMGGLAFWMPRYLEEEQAPPFLGILPRTFFGVLTVLTGLTATLAGGMLGDRLRTRYPGSYFLVSGLALMIGFPMSLLMLISPFPVAWVFCALSVMCLFFNTGPTNTILANVTAPSIRASAFALNILIIHAFGDAISPYVIGLVFQQTGSLKWGFALVSASMLVGGILWLLGMRHLERDTRAISG